MIRYFQPGPRCGNCNHFLSATPDDQLHNGHYCRKGLDPKTCDTAFTSRTKEKKKRRIKPWQQERSVMTNLKRRFV